MLGKDYSEIGTLFEDGSFFWVASESCGFSSISDLAKAQASGKPPLNLTVVGPPVDNGLGKSSSDLVDKLNVKRKQAGLDELLYVKNFKAEAATTGGARAVCVHAMRAPGHVSVWVGGAHGV